MRQSVYTGLLLTILCSAGTVAWALQPGYPPRAHAPYPPHTPGYAAGPAAAVVPTQPLQARLAYPRPWLPYPWTARPPAAARSNRAPARRARATRPESAEREHAEPAAAAQGTPPQSDQAAGAAARQRAFLERLRPLVEAENRRLRELRSELRGLLAPLERGGNLEAAQRERLEKLAARYRVDGDPLTQASARSALLDRIDEVPVSLALAQAANESAWGTSRFAREGNNLFGIWTYDEDKGMVPRKRASGKKHLVRRFESVAASVRYYIFTLNSHPAYAKLRSIRADLRAAGQPLDGAVLAAGLSRYSAKGEQYVHLIQAMIRRFDLAAFDAAPRGRA